MEHASISNKSHDDNFQNMINVNVIDINVQCVTNESDEREYNDLGRRDVDHN